MPCSELAEEKFALYPRVLAPGCYDAVEAICRAAGFTPKVGYESNDISVALSLLPTSGAVTLLPECVRKLQTSEVVFRDIEGDVTTVACGFLRRAGDGSPHVDRLLKMWRAVRNQPK